MFHFSVDRGKHLLTCTVVGHVLPEEVTRFDRELKAAALEARGASGHFDMLSRLDELAVMTRENAHHTEGWIDWLKANGIRKCANVVGSTLLKLQIARISPDPRWGLFANDADALAWLAEP
jgi:hypothetical protein